MRLAAHLLFFGGIAAAQVEIARPQPAAAAPAPVALTMATPVVTLDITPLAPPDLSSPYASPRDAARHRFQSTVSDLKATRNSKAALQGFAEALLMDRTYAAAAFNLGVLSAIAEKWEDALGAFEEAVRLDPNELGKVAMTQVERLHLINSLQATPDGQRKLRYDEALYPVATKLSKMRPADAMSVLAGVGRIDPKRWEAPALLASLNGNGRGYDVAAKFLEIAVANAPEPAIKARLEKALHAAERELRYIAARAEAEAAADRGEYDKAAELYETAWTTTPARSSNGMDAASVYLLRDDTVRASTLLLRLRDSGNDEFSPLASAMLKELEPIEPGAKAAVSDEAQFFKDPGSGQPVQVSTLVPPVDTSSMELLARPLPKLVLDPEPAVLLAALSANPAEAAQAAMPPLPAPRVAGDRPWWEVLQLRNAAAATETGPGPEQSADISRGAKIRRLLHVTSQPAGARIFIADGSDALCQAPCLIQAAAANYQLRVSLPGYQDQTRQIRVAAAGAELAFVLQAVRGNITVETSAPATLKVNDTPVNGPAPVTLSLVPGLYRITADFGSATRERLITIKPSAQLRLDLRP
jgi:tetratricopeptide (TPR) repeat protein